MKSETLISDFIESLDSEKAYSDNTCRAYRTDLNAFAAFAVKNQPARRAHRSSGAKYPRFKIENVDALTIRLYLGYLYKKNAKTTIGRKLSAIRSFSDIWSDRELLRTILPIRFYLPNRKNTFRRT